MLLDWTVDWENQRMASLLTGNAGNLNHSKLAQEQLEVATGMLNQPPGDEYLPAVFRDAPTLNHWL